MPLSDQELADCARECMATAGQRSDPSNVDEDARDVLRRLVDDRNHAIRQKHRAAIRALRRVLAVDMNVQANRKGAIPRALGLVGRATKANTVKHRAIVLMVDRLLAWREEKEVDGEVIFPYNSIRKAADAVAIGFFEADLDSELTGANVEKIWSRQP